MEFLVLSLFCVFLLLCIVLDISILYALGAGLALFLFYGAKKGFTWRELMEMTLSGIRTVKNILITFFLIGILTALWRSAGTIPVIICYSAKLIQPSLFLLMTFLLNCMVSILTGTAFGTAATMGVICATMAATMGISPVLVGGAVLSGVFFGDRCSPVSTSALLVSELTKTSIFDNIRLMIRTAAVPFAVTCMLYAAIGFFTPHSGELMDLYALFGREFELQISALLPAALILILSCFKVNVKLAMSASILSALPLCFFLQGVGGKELLRLAVFGFEAADAEVASMLNGGGIVSMVKVACIVCLSSSYSGIFQKTGMLESIKQRILVLGTKITPYGATLCTALLASMIACNQTLAIMLTSQLCRDLEPDKQKFAIDLENTAVVVAPLVPWSIASGVPLASVGAPMAGILAACFLYLLPLWRLILETGGRKRTGARLSAGAETSMRSIL